MHQAVKAYLANQRQGNASTKIAQVRDGRQPEAVEAEGNRSRAPGLDACAALGGWWNGLRTDAARLRRSTCRTAGAGARPQERAQRARARGRDLRDRRVRLRCAEDLARCSRCSSALGVDEQEGADPDRRRQEERVPQRPQPAERARDAVRATRRRTTSSGSDVVLVESGAIGDAAPSRRRREAVRTGAQREDDAEGRRARSPRRRRPRQEDGREEGRGQEDGSADARRRPPRSRPRRSPRRSQRRRSKPMPTLHRTIVRPIITEKSSAAYQDRGEYTSRCIPTRTSRRSAQAIETAVRRHGTGVWTSNQPRQGQARRAGVGKRALEKGDRDAARRRHDRRSSRAKSEPWQFVNSSQSPRARASARSRISPRSRAATPEKSLLEPIKKSGGRDNHGHISMRRVGGGHKRQYRIIDFKRNKLGDAGDGRARSSTIRTARRVSRWCSTRTARSATSCTRRD